MKRKFLILIDYFLIVGAFSSSTETFAYLCNYLPSLGSKYFGFMYQPFQILIWSFTVRVDGNQFYIAYSVLGVLSFIILGVSIFIFNKLKADVSDLYGSSRWLKYMELKKLGCLNPGGVVLGQTHKAYYSYNSDTDKYTLEQPGEIIFNSGSEHLLIIAPTGRGKGINFVIPSLLSYTSSVVVYDIKKENFDVTSGWRRQFSHVIRFEPAAGYSARFNPLFEIEKGPKEVGQVQNIASILCDPNGKGESDHWQKSAHQLLVGVILHVLYAGTNKTLYGVYEYLNNPNQNITQSLELMLETKHLGVSTHPVVAQTARNMLNKSFNELSGVVSTASSFLSLFQDPYVHKNTAVSDFNINQLMFSDTPMSLYLVVSPVDSDRMRPLIRLTLQMIGKKLTEKLGGHKQKLLFLIDEFPTLGNLEFFESQLAFFRGYGIKCALIAQSFNQFYKHYTRDTSIMDNCKYKLILGADNPTEAKIVADYLGQETILKKSTSKSGNVSHVLMSNKSISESDIGRNLMTPDEVLRLPFDDILLLCGGTYPYKGKKIMYYLDDRFSGRANLPTPESQADQEKEFIKSGPSVWEKTKPVQQPKPVEPLVAYSSFPSPERKEEKPVISESASSARPVQTFNPLNL